MRTCSAISGGAGGGALSFDVAGVKAALSDPGLEPENLETNLDSLIYDLLYTGIRCAFLYTL